MVIRNNPKWSTRIIDSLNPVKLEIQSIQTGVICDSKSSDSKLY